MLRFYCILFCIFYSGGLHALDYGDLREAEKIALSLTGKPLPDAMREAFVKGTLSNEQIALQLIASSEFVEHVAKFWSHKLGITAPLSMSDMMQPSANTRIGRLAQGYSERFNAAAPLRNPGFIDNFINTVGSLTTPVDIRATNCPAHNAITIWHPSINSAACMNSIISTGKHCNSEVLATAAQLDAYRRLQNHWYKVSVPCRLSAAQMANLTTEVAPFWDQSGKRRYLAANYLLSDDRCGPDLSKCYSEFINWDYELKFAEDSTLEPGRIIGQTIADDLPFSSILTTTKTVMSGALAHFMQNYLPDWENFPGGAYEETRADFTSPDHNNSQTFWVERNDAHAGLLTTFAYHFITNGRRAKANRAFEVFSCSQFTVPDEARPDPSDANPDLRERTYCAYCHRTLEPMAAFFNRWPKTGRVNFEIDNGDSIDDRGLYLGTEATSITGFAKILANSDAFAKCSIKRTFEFIYGRQMSEPESQTLLPRYLEMATKNDGKLKAVIAEMVIAEEFLRTQDQ